MADYTNKPSTPKCKKESENAVPAYEVTAVLGGGAKTDCASANDALIAIHSSQPMQPNTHIPQHDSHKKKNWQYGSPSFDVSCTETSLQAPSANMHQAPARTTRKRKLSSYGTASTYDDEGDETRSTRSTSDKKQNHSEIEKRRRDKMNTYISELSAMVPMCGAMARKLDKLTVLRMAVQHLRSIRGALSACPLTARPRPALISERELNTLILQAAHDTFLLVIGCDRGRLLYASSSVKSLLHYDQTELVGQSLFDILHPKDVTKVKEQLSSPDLSPRERLIDAKTMLPVKADLVAGATRLCPGARRSFFCRIKCKQASAEQNPLPVPIKEETEPSSKMRKKQQDKKYCVVQCTGYLKSWVPVELSEGANTSEVPEDGEACSLSCLVAVGRALPDLTPAPYTCSTPPTRLLQYVSRHAPDGKFTFVDQRVKLALGFLPQELLGTSLYEYVSGPELGAVARTHKTALLHRDQLHTPPYFFRRKDGTFARIQTHFKPFKNPWTKDIECLVANNSLVTDNQTNAHLEESHGSYDLYKQKADVEMQRLIESQVESHKIGSAIAEEAFRRSSAEFSPELPVEILQDVVYNHQQASLVDNTLGIDVGYCQVRNNVPLSAAGTAGSPPPSGNDCLPARASSPISPPLPTLGLDGNGEAAMAVIMSLLEADAGLGDPVNFAGLPWPLP